MRKGRKTKAVVTLKDILKAKKLLDEAPVPSWDRVYWNGEIGTTFVEFSFYNGKKKKQDIGSRD